MYFYLMLILVVILIALVAYWARVAVRVYEAQVDQDILQAKASYQKMVDQKKTLDQDKEGLRSEADRIFSLYDLTRDITKTFDEQEAFHAFVRHLRRQFPVDDCQLIAPGPTTVSDDVSFQGYLFFPLKAKRVILGEIAYRGLRPEHRDVFTILAHQFAFALHRIRLYREVENMAITDSLTHLHTRRYLMERLSEEFSRAQLRKMPLSFVMIDVDHFKRINDQYGHLSGDKVLREVGRVVSQVIREIDIAGRYGGEEFCVILPDTDKQGGLLAAERLRTAINGHKIKAFDVQLEVKVSCGVATFPDDALHVDEVIDKADWALYRAKRAGRNRVVGFSADNE